MSGRLIAFRPARVNCTSCGTHFRPMRPEHHLCRQCWQWVKALTGVMHTRIAFDALRGMR